MRYKYMVMREVSQKKISMGMKGKEGLNCNITLLLGSEVSMKNSKSSQWFPCDVCDSIIIQLKCLFSLDALNQFVQQFLGSFLPHLETSLFWLFDRTGYDW